MTKQCEFALLLCAVSLGTVLAQESPPPTEPQSTESPSAEAPAATIVASPTAVPAATSPAVRNVRISFLPPPLEGKISLGIYASTGELVRVLHKEAPFDEFTIGADALVTKWDGKDDAGKDLPAGKYHARGFLVGPLKSEDAGTSTDPPADADASGNVQVKLTANPLSKNAGAIVDLAVAFDEKRVFLRTADGLPVYTAGLKNSVSRAWIKKNSEKTVDIFVDENGPIAHLLISNVDKMMAFDCGDLELK